MSSQGDIIFIIVEFVKIAKRILQSLEDPKMS